MIDITNKIETLRVAVAEAVLKVSDESVAAVKNNEVPKGDVFTSAKISALLAIKNTSSVLPHCHPIPVEYADVQFEIKGKNIISIEVEVKTIYKTGCEMEALHGASVAALTVYDMLKPIDKKIEIKNIRLLKKSGGKSDSKFYYDSFDIEAAVMVISDSVYNKKAKDESGKFIKEKLESANIVTKYFEVVPDDIKNIQNKIKSYCKKKIDLIITTGGTGVSPRDVTFEAVKPLIEKEISGVMESARTYGQKKTPYAMLSRSIAGFIGETLVLTFPGSVNGVNEYFDALFPYILHLFKVRKGFKH
ncbi:MAG: bifunctional molybdenum cofactor biosynthesis protein MoaC/MoaB [Bacteroidota bacterium]|nr:bifunctional molybdenum cofactor biosynthesis protein MoaC/MoaB [Bacteroidota bacterium]